MERPKADHYRVLQVDPAANPLVIQAAYRVLAQIFHPDVSGDDADMKRINAAWEVLGDPRKRRQYDIERAGRHAPMRAAAAGPAAASPAAASPAAAHRASTPHAEQQAGPPVGPASGSVLRFGRYEGWTVGQVARVDPAFLEWLRAVPLGRALKPEIDLALQRAEGARRMGVGGGAGATAGATNGQRVHAWAPGASTRVR